MEKQPRCLACRGPYHEATGNYYKEFDVVICGACYKDFLYWLRGHLKRRWGKCNFYEEAATSIRPGIYPVPGVGVAPT